ncbi:MAG: helix-turn-helix domain-containing protein [Bacilli bacterium]
MNIEIANRLVDLRKKSGFSQEELAAKLGLSRQAVSKWERAEASPDTDNLICLAKLYGVSLDDLLNTDESVDEIVKEQVKPQEEEKDASEAGQQEKTEGAPSEDKKADTSQKEEKKAEDEGNPANAKSEVHIDSSGIHFKDGSSEGSIDSSGIHVTSKKNEVHIDGTGIHVNDGVVYDGENIDKERARAHRYHVAESIVSSVVTILATAAYLLCGFLIPNVRLGWGSCWIVFFLIPLASTFVAALKKRRFCAFAFPVLVTAIYLLLGVVYGLWHPEWVIFFSIPVYYMAFGPIDEAIRRHLREKGILYDGDDDDEDDDDDDDDDAKKKDAIDAEVK